MMYIKINDRDPPHPMPLLQIPRRNRNVGKQTKPHRPIRLRMMPRRPNRRERPLHPPIHHRITTRQPRPHRQQRRLKTTRTRRRIPLIQNPIERSNMPHPLDMLHRMHFQQPANLRLRRHRLQFHQRSARGRHRSQIQLKIRKRIGRHDQPGLTNRSINRPDPIRPFRVVRPRLMLHKPWAAAESDHPNIVTRQPIATSHQTC